MSAYQQLDKLKNKKIFDSIHKNKTVMDDVETGIEILGNIPTQTPKVILIESIRVNIQEQAKELDAKAKWLNILDWILFFSGFVSSGLTILYFNIQICYQLNLIQLFGIIALLSRLIEKGLSMTKIAKNTKLASASMKELLREITAIEIQFYDKDVDQDVLLTKVINTVNQIWAEFDDLGLQTFIQPNVIDQARQQNLNIQLQLNTVPPIINHDVAIPPTSVIPSSSVIPNTANGININMSGDNITVTPI